MLLSAILTLRDVEMARESVFKFRRSVKVGFSLAERRRGDDS